MAWNGSGTFDRTQDFSADRDSGAPDHFIDADKMDDELDNLQAGIQACLPINGEQALTGDVEFAGFNIQELGVAFLKEQAAADADVAGEGQIWVKTATPNQLWFTDDAGTDFQLGSGLSNIVEDTTPQLGGNLDGQTYTITTTGVITGATFDATGDVSAGDNAAFGYNSTDGAVITGQGTAGDVTIKNDAGTTVWQLLTGTSEVDITGTFDVIHTAAQDDDHAIEIECDAAGFGGVKGLDIDFITGAIETGDVEAAILVNLDEASATGGEVFGIEVLATSGSADATWGYKAGAEVGLLKQDSGTFANPTTGTNNTTATDVPAMIDGSTGTNTTIFVNDNDYIIIGAAAAFTEISFVIETPAGNPGITPVFGYSTAGSGQFTTFAPIDGTNGFRNTGVVAWDAADLTGHVANDDTSTFDIKITRTHNSKGNVSLYYAETASTTVYSWDENGDLDINDIKSAGTISMTEQAAANADVAARGQLWVKTKTPNLAMFTDDAGTDWHLNGVTTPEAYGATGDGTTDDTTAFTNALNAGKAVYCDGSTSYAVGDLSVGTNQTILGNGARFKRVSGASNVFVLDAVKGSIQDVQINGQNTWQSSTVNGAQTSGNNTIILDDATGFVAGMWIFLRTANETKIEGHEITNVATNTLTLARNFAGNVSDGVKVVGDFGLLHMGGTSLSRPSLHNITIYNCCVGITSGETGADSSNAYPMMDNIRIHSFIGAGMIYSHNVAGENANNIILNGGYTQNNDYTGDNVTTDFAYPYSISEETYRGGGEPSIRVYLDGVKQTLTTHYTVNESTGNVEMVSAPGSSVDIDVTNFEYGAFALLADAVETSGADSNGRLSNVLGITTNIGYYAIDCDLMFMSNCQFDTCGYAGCYLSNCDDQYFRGTDWLFSPFPIIVKSDCNDCRFTDVTTSIIPDASEETATSNKVAVEVEAGATGILVARNERIVSATVTNYTTATATGDGQFYFHVPEEMNTMNLVEVHGEVITAGTTGTTDIQIYNVTQAQDMLTTKLTIDSGETGSDTAAAAAVIGSSVDDVITNDLLRIDIDAVSTTPALGLIVTLTFRAV